MVIVTLLTLFFSYVHCQSPIIADPPAFPWSPLRTVGPNTFGGTLAFGVATQSFVGIDGELVTRGYLGYGVDPGCGPFSNVFPSLDNVLSKASATSPEQCFRLCVMNRKCACYGYNSGECLLQTNCQRLNNVTNAYTGLVRESEWDNVSSSEATPFSITNSTSASDCSAMCRSNLGCASYTFYHNTCKLIATFTPSFVNLAGSTYGAMCRGFTIPGPTITVSRGSTYYITLLNTLNYQHEGVMNTIGDANITNIHTHGLHISPVSPSDDIFITVNGGECFQYTWCIPSNHMGGTMWWHPNHHGSSSTQVSGGALGLLIVKDDPIMDGTPQAILDMKTRLLVIQAIHACTADTLLSQSTIGGTIYLVNGVYMGRIVMQANTWERWRILHADSEPGYITISFPTFCTVHLLAQDGVWRSQVPTVLAKPFPNPTVNVTGATRLDLAVSCSPSTLPSDGSFTRNGFTLLSTIHVVSSSSPLPPSTAFPSWVPIFPDYLPASEWLGATDYQSASILATAESIQVGNDAEPFNPNHPKINITNSNTVQKWSITAPMTMYSFHVCVNHFLVTADCGDFKKGEFYDVIVSNGNPCSILYVPYFEGRVIMHCHNLIHEDMGVMTFANVLTGPGGPTSSGANTPNACSMFPSVVSYLEENQNTESQGLSEIYLLYIIIGLIAALFVGQTLFLVFVIMRFRRLVREATSDNYSGWIDRG